MNKKGDLVGLGLFLFIGSLIFFTAYSMMVYIPAMQADIGNSEALISALWVGMTCGIVGTIGLIMAKR